MQKEFEAREAKRLAEEEVVRQTKVKELEVCGCIHCVCALLKVYLWTSSHAGLHKTQELAKAAVETLDTTELLACLAVHLESRWLTEDHPATIAARKTGPYR